MTKKLRILILEDVPTDAELMIEELAEAGMTFVSKRVSTKASFVSAIADFSPAIILSDYSLPSFDGLAALKIAREKCPDVPFIFVSGALGEEMAIDLLKKGATDYVLKNRLSRLEPAVSRALHEVEERREHERAEHALTESEVRYRTIFENTGTATVIVEEDATIVLANRQFERLTGFSRSEIEGKKKWTEFVLEDDLPKVKALTRAGGKHSRAPSDGYEFRITNNRNGILNVLANVAAIPSTRRTVMSLLDISKLKKAERERREASLYARSLIEAGIDPLITINADGKIMDVNSAAEATRKIVASATNTKVIALSMHSDRRFVIGMLEAGASGYLLKDCAFGELASAIRQVISGNTYLSPRIADVVVKAYLNKAPNSTLTTRTVLTSREREILQLLAEGLSAKEIAAHLNLSIKTVETHRRNIMEKLNIHTIAELTKYAIREGLVALET